LWTPFIPDIQAAKKYTIPSSRPITPKAEETASRLAETLAIRANYSKSDMPAPHVNLRPFSHHVARLGAGASRSFRSTHW
jgi:hypothetical protein